MGISKPSLPPPPAVAEAVPAANAGLLQVSLVRLGWGSVPFTLKMWGKTHRPGRGSEPCTATSHSSNQHGPHGQRILPSSQVQLSTLVHPGRLQVIVQYLGPCHPHQTPSWSSRLPASDRPSPSPCSHLGRQPEDERFSVCPSVCRQ